MKRVLILLAAIVVGLLVLSRSYVQPAPRKDFDLRAFGSLPVVANGRTKPIDTVARTTLLGIQGRQTIYLEDGRKLTPIEWLLDVSYRPEVAETYRIFKIDDPELLALIGKTEDSLRIRYTGVKRVLAIFGFVPTYHRRFAYSELASHLEEIDKQGKAAAELDPKQRTPFQKAVHTLRLNLISYQGLQFSLGFGPDAQFSDKLGQLDARLHEAIRAVRAKIRNEPHDEALAASVEGLAQQFDVMAQRAQFLASPPPAGDPKATWQTNGAALIESFRTGQLDPIGIAYAALGKAWRLGQTEDAAKHSEHFNTIIGLYGDTHLRPNFGKEVAKVEQEVLFNRIEPFYTSMVLYGLIALTALGALLFRNESLRQGAFWMLVLAAVAMTVGLIFRIYIGGRPPVTNLHSSALFIGWAVVFVCLLLERLFPISIPTLVGGIIGFCTMIIAHHLAIGNDTLEMMQAVLDTNFWLATHVLVITLGYAATFLAGFLAIIYIVAGMSSSVLRRESSNGKARTDTLGDTLARMTYAIVCFATLGSLVGTILGGIWADDSWGRFWGWDPKENGALIIVLWNALVLHARWGGLVRQRGFMVLAVGGNIVTAWSWFGTNMLGIGLHSYGFMDKAFFWLVGFVLLNFVIMVVAAAVPTRRWRSFGPGPDAQKPA